jgi:NTE family protein
VSDKSDRERAPVALVLTGGGARAAYQVGVLQAICEILPNPRVNPFPIICGTSAGAINAVSLACHAENFQSAVDAVAGVWRNFRAHQVYRADGLGIAVTGLRWLSTLAVGWLTHRAPRSLLDNTPLGELLTRQLDFGGIDRAIGSGALRAVSVTASGYASGESVSFFQASGSVEPWRRAQRMGCRTRLGVDHLLASSAIPFVFPAQRIHREYFGDGSMRQLAPMSPAVHLGAQRILIIGSGRLEEPADQRKRQFLYPSLAQVAGHAMSSIFLDSLPADVEQLERINQLLGRIAPDALASAGVSFRPIETLLISPSERLDDLATRHAGALPRPVRMMLGGIGGTRRRGGALVSYLLFEPPYTRALMRLGHRDAMARQEEIRTFFAQ